MVSLFSKHKLLLGLLLCFISTASFSQVLITYPTTSDTVLCNGGPITLHAINIGRVPTNVNFGVSAPDDYYSTTTIPIGFSFDFYGNTYTNCVVSSNGYITFNSSSAGMPSAWSLSSTSGVPGNTNALNSLLGCYSDIYLNANNGGGTIDYATIGTAPNREFIVTFCNVPMFSCTSQHIIFQMILYETSNLLDVYIKKKVICSNWNGGLAVQGVQNSTGTVGTAVPGRNSTTWTANHDGQRFTPNSAFSSYADTSVPYIHIPDSSAPLMWFKGFPISGPLLATGDTLTVNPDTPTTYTVLAVDCGDTSFAHVTVVIGHQPTIDSVIAIPPSYCGDHNGNITLLGGFHAGDIDTIFYTMDGIGQQPIVDTVSPDSTLVIPNLYVNVPGYTATYDNIYVKNGPCVSNVVGPYTFTIDTVTASFTDLIHYGCNGDTVILTNLSAPSFYPLQYTWAFGDGNTDNAVNPEHVYTTQGDYTIQLVTTANGNCPDTVTQAVHLLHPLHAVFSTDKDSICLNGPVNFTNSSIDSLGTYLWTFADNDSDTTTNPSHIYTNTGVYDAKLFVTDFVPCIDSAAQNIYVASITAIPPFTDTSLCLIDSLKLPVQITTSGPDIFSSYTYQWTPTDGLGDPTAQQPNFFTYGDYNFIFTVTANPTGCTASDTIVVNSFPPLTLDSVTTSQSINYGSSIQLNAGGGYYYVWLPNDGSLNNPNIANPIATPLDSTTYTVIGMTQLGCRDSATVSINVINPQLPVMPNAFTPDNKEYNTVFRIVNLKFQKLVDFSIYNRWGNRVFQTTDPAKGWDGNYNGQPQGMDTYNYMIVVVQTDGTEKSYRGTVTLIR